MASLEFFDGTNWIVIGGSSGGNIHLVGDIIGNGVINGITETNINITRNFDVKNYKIINLKPPESGNDAVNYKLMFDLLQDETELVWQQAV